MSNPYDAAIELLEWHMSEYSDDKDWIGWRDAITALKDYEKVKAKLEAARPLLDTIYDADMMVAVTGKVHGFSAKSEKDIIVNALAYRAAKEPT